jgi:ABC-type Na+ transport system ATPase subunit NatA
MNSSFGPPQVIEVRNLCKSYDGKIVIDHLTFTVQSGVVTGFLGPNGAGKSTTMRLLVGLDRPTSGDATIGGVHYVDLPRPLRVVGALLDAGATHKGRSAFDHLLYLAQTQGIARRRVDEVLDLVGLHDVAHERAGSFSLGMGQRLGLAAALIGDPQVLILDEPVNELDPDGIMWIRNLVTHLAGQGRTILISSHLMSEMAIQSRPRAPRAHPATRIARGRVHGTDPHQHRVRRPRPQRSHRDAGNHHCGSSPMTATITPAPSPNTQLGPTGVDIGGLVKSEWTKIRSLRSSVAALVLLFVLTVGFTVLFVGLTVSQWDKVDAVQKLAYQLDPTRLIPGAGFQISQLPGSIGDHVHAYLPTVAGQLMVAARQGQDDLMTPLQGFGVFCLWTLALMLIANVLLRRRDA